MVGHARGVQGVGICRTVPAPFRIGRRRLGPAGKSMSGTRRRTGRLAYRHRRPQGRGTASERLGHMDYIERRAKRLEADYRHCLRDYKRALSRTWILRDRLGRHGRHRVPIVQSLRRGGMRRMAATSYKRGSGTVEGVRPGRTAPMEQGCGRALPDADAGRHAMWQTHRGRLPLVRRTCGHVGRLRPVGEPYHRYVA